MSTRSRGPPRDSLARDPSSSRASIAFTSKLNEDLCRNLLLASYLESFFIVVMYLTLTYENTASANAGVYHIRELQL